MKKLRSTWAIGLCVILTSACGAEMEEQEGEREAPQKVTRHMAPKPSSFAHLTTLEIIEGYLAEEGEAPAVHYLAEGAEVHNRLIQAGDPEFEEYHEYHPEYKLLTAQLGPELPPMTITFSEGASVDPYFDLHIGQKLFGTVEGVQLYAPGNGFIYTTGHANTMFNMRRKYKVTADSLQEVRQPYYYVGLISHTTADLTLYADRTGDQVVARLPKGTDVEVVINEDRDFLIRTPLGLVGWLRDCRSYESGIEGLFYAGD